MTGSREPKLGHVLKRIGPHDLVIPVPQFENPVFHLVLTPGQQSLTAGGKKEPILDSYFYENTCLCMLSARHNLQNLFKPSNNFKRLMVAFLLDFISDLMA